MTTLIFGIVLILVGLLIKYGKMYCLIAGLNTMNHKHRAEYNLEEIGTLFRNVLGLVGIFMITGNLITRHFGNNLFDLLFTLVPALVGCIALLAMLNSDKYKNSFLE
jgi:hypothetical protein